VDQLHSLEENPNNLKSDLSIAGTYILEHFDSKHTNNVYIIKYYSMLKLENIKYF